MTLLSLHFSLLLGWEQGGVEVGRRKRPGTQSSLTAAPNLLCLPTIYSRAPLDPHRQHVVVEALGLQAPHLPVKLNLLPFEAFQAIQEKGGL